MNIGLLIRGVKAGAKLAGRGAKATGRGAKAGAKAAGRGAKGAAKATARKAKGAAKKVGNTKVARGAKRVGGKVVENVGYAATPGLRRAKTAAGSTRYFKKGKGTGPIKSIAKAKVKRTGKRVTAGASVLAGGGEAARRKSKSKKEAAAAKAKRDAAAAKARAATPKTPTRAATPKTPAKKAVKKALPAYARLGEKPTASRKSRFENMTTYQKNRLKGKDLVAYRNYLKSKKK